MNCYTHFAKFLGRLIRASIDDHILNGAAALAYFLFLSLFPLLIVILSIVSFLPFSKVDAAILQYIHRAFPPEAAKLVEDFVVSINGEHQTHLLSFGILAVIWSSSSGFSALVENINQIHKIKDRRPYWKIKAASFFLLLIFVVLVFGSSILIVLSDSIFNWLLPYVGNGVIWIWMFGLIQWIIVIGALFTAFSAVQYLAYAQKNKYRMFTKGISVSVVLFVASCFCLKLYIDTFSTLSVVYGSLGAIITLMLWFYIIGFIFLVGAEVDELLNEAQY